ncbi:hypothetical protein LCGC14_0738790 [marine sediment metagenome]|uniref:Sulfate adenylyltransferase subunit 2 n=1 Tax=marine sediment metagenome TaxID=412755 RepID=A0A0F9QBL4_9ZZZZ
MNELVEKSIFILRETYATCKKPAILWSTGKDSTAALSLCRQAFHGDIPFPVIHIDTGQKFPEMYVFRDKLAKEWNMDLIVTTNPRWVGKMSPEKNKFECCNKLKTDALKMCLKEYGFDALILAIRRDEHGIRAKERVFSPRDDEFNWDHRNQPVEMWNLYHTETKGHTRIHPILHWREIDVWNYIKEMGLPCNSMYFAEEGKRYRSLGCEPCTDPIDSTASTIDEVIEELRTTKKAEREGRAQDKENAFNMEKLRHLGYM